MATIQGTGQLSLYDQFDGISGVLSNDSHVLPADSAGVVTNFANAVSSLSIFNGAVDDTANWVITQALTGTGFTVTASGTPANKTATVTAIGSATDIAKVTFTATRAGFTNIVKVFTVSKSKTGATGGTGGTGTPGAPGTSPTAYWLISSVPVISKSIAGVYAPTTISVTGKSQNGIAAPIDYAGRFVIADSPDGTTFTDRYTSVANEVTKVYTPLAGIKTLRVRFYLAGGVVTLLDEQHVSVVLDGATGGTGSAGSPAYVHIAYANSSDGVTGFSTTVSAGKLFMGTYSDNTAADSGTPSVYSWTLIKGDIGDTGNTGPSGELNLVSNPHVTGTAAGWSGGGVYATTAFVDARTIGAINLTSTADLMQQATIFDIEPQKMYEYSVWVKQSVTKGTNYLGFYGYNSAAANIGAYPISTATGIKSGTLTTNGYFWSGSLTAGVWVKLTGYIIPAGYPTTDVELFKNIGEGGITSIFQFPSDARKASMRVLNYGNAGVSSTLTMALPMVKEVDISVLEANRVKNLNKKVEDKINNAVTTIDGSGVTVKDGNFILQDAISNTKYSVDSKRNLVKDHSFEMIQTAGSFGTYGNLFTSKNPQNNSGIGWQVAGYPMIRPYYDIDGSNQWIMFGNQSAVVDYGNRFYQDIPIVPLVNYPYAVSFYATTPIGMTAGIPKLVVEWWTGGALSSTQSFTFAIPSTTWGQKTRYSAAVAVPNPLTYNTDSFMRVYVHTPTTGTFTEIDGFQVIEGTLPTVYNDEASLWEITTGQQIAEYVRIRSLEAETVSAMVKMFTQDIDVMGNLNLYSTIDASANSTTHAFTIGSNTTGVSLKMDANEISAFNGSLPSELHVNPDGGRVVFNNNGVGSNLVIDGGYITNMNRVYASLVNGWLHYSATDDAFIRASYWKDKNNVVHVEGMIKSGTTASGTTLFTLPAGYRPVGSSIHVQHSDNTAKQVRVDVSETGIVNINEISGTWISLSGITFRAEN